MPTFVPQNPGVQHARPVLQVSKMHVRVADAGRDDLHQQLVILDGSDGHVFELPLPFADGAVGDDGLGGFAGHLVGEGKCFYQEGQYGVKTKAKLGVGGSYRGTG